MTTIDVTSSSGPYSIRISRGALSSLGSLLKDLFPGLSRIGFVSNPVVWSHYGSRVLASSDAYGFQSVVALHQDGESFKTMASVMELLTEFLQHRWERRDPLCVVGGGVSGDMGGLVSALLLRGVPLIHIPTTVVAQVDSSIGGKTGVDHPLGKNLIGTFKPPVAILTDPDLLSTLSLRERRAGLGEVLKYAFIGDPTLLKVLEDHVEKLSGASFHGNSWEEVVTLCSSDKARIVSADEKESGERMLLNFGHTFGHALEGAMGYSGLLHGEAVALGMLAAASISVAAGMAAPKTFSQMRSLIERAGLPVMWPHDITYDSIHPYLFRDKKLKGGEVTLILPEVLGHVRIVRDYDPALLSRGVF